MIDQAFDLGEEITLKTLQYTLNQNLWNQINLQGINLDFDGWERIKYLNEAGNDLSAEVDAIPNNSGGLYLFYLKCPIITGITEYPFYIGRAQHTAHQNLRKRVKEYFQKFARNAERPKITKMFKYWGSDLFVAYRTLNANEDIVDLEKGIINSLLLPMNDAIPDQIIRQAVQAF